MVEVAEWLGNNVGTWLTAGVVASVVSFASTQVWERRKLTRGERAAAYAAFLDASSRRRRAFADRDGAAKAEDADRLADAESRVVSTRYEQWAAYAQIQILGSPKAVEAALHLINAYDSQNQNFRERGSAPSVGNDRLSLLLADLVGHARRDLSLGQLNRERLKQISREWKLTNKSVI